MRKGIVAICFLLVCPMLLAQTLLDNSSVVKMLKSGLSEDVIISAINASPANYNTSAEGLIALKKAGASDKLVAAIVVRNAHAATEKPTIFPAPAPELPPVAAPVPMLRSRGCTRHVHWQWIVWVCIAKTFMVPGKRLIPRWSISRLVAF